MDALKSFRVRKYEILSKCIKSIVLFITVIAIVFGLPFGVFDIKPEAATTVDEYFESAKRYYYNQLNDFEKAVFKKYEQLTVENPVVTLSAEEIAGYSESEVRDMCERAYTAFVTDDPKNHMIWNRWISELSVTDQNAVIRLGTTKIYSENELKKAENRISQIKDAVGTDGDLYTRVRKLWQFFWNNMAYNGYYPFTGERIACYDDSALGCFNRNSAICAGFSDAFKIMCNELGIPCIVVGNAGHAWNFVQMDDGNWYSIDPSMSSATDKVYLHYLLIGKLDIAYSSDSSYSISDLYIAKEGDFSFPVLSDYAYVYGGTNTDFTATEKVNEIEIDEYEYIVNEDGTTCTITNYLGKESGDLIVPETIDGYAVTVIGEGAYFNCRGFTGSLIIPGTVKTIDDNAFMLCCNLSGELLLPDGLEEIGKGAFTGCEKISGSLSLPENLAKIEYAAFYDCKSFTGNLVFPDNIEIEGYAFWYCTGLNGTCKLPDNESFDLSNGILTGCNFTAYEVSENNPIYSVYDGVIYSKDMTKLISCPSGKIGELKIPDTVVTIGKMACQECTQLTGELVIPYGVKYIEDDAFSGASFTGDLILPDSIVEIGYGAFGASSTTIMGELVLPANLQTLEAWAFANRYFECEINIPDTLVNLPSVDDVYPIMTNDNVLLICNCSNEAFINFTCTSNWGNPWRSLRIKHYGEEIDKECINCMKAVLLCEISNIEILMDGSDYTEDEHAAVNEAKLAAESGSIEDINKSIEKLKSFTGYTMSGTVTSFGDDASGVTVSLIDSEGNEVVSAVTGAEGTYEFTAIPAGIYTLTLSKESHVTREYTVTISTETVQDVVVNYIGDINGDGKVNVNDLTKVRKIILDKSTDKTSYSYSCADANCDGKVNVNDLTRIRKHINKSNTLF